VFSKTFPYCADDFYTFDRDQAKLARAAGLRVLGVHAPQRRTHILF
jgi:hypothetical protein